MYEMKRLGLALTPAEKTAVEEMAGAAGGMSHCAPVRRFVRNAARERGMWPPVRSQRAVLPIQEAQNG